MKDGRRRENIRIRQKARTSAPGNATDTNSELRYVYGWTSNKPHAPKRSKPPESRPKSRQKGMKKMERDRRREDVMGDPLGLKKSGESTNYNRSGGPSSRTKRPVKRFR